MTLASAPEAASLIGMRSIRSTAAIWKQVQPVQCWADSCFNWAHYDDGYFELAGTGCIASLYCRGDARQVASSQVLQLLDTR